MDAWGRTCALTPSRGLLAPVPADLMADDAAHGRTPERATDTADGGRADTGANRGTDTGG